MASEALRGGGKGDICVSLVAKLAEVADAGEDVRVTRTTVVGFPNQLQVESVSWERQREGCPDIESVEPFLVGWMVPKNLKPTSRTDSIPLCQLRFRLQDSLCTTFQHPLQRTRIHYERN